MSKAEPTFTVKKPSDEIVAQAAKATSVVDAKGRTITLQKPGVLAQFRMIDMLGESAKNQVYVGMVLPLMYVAAIDGEPTAKISTRRELEALIQSLDEEGVTAIAEGVQLHFGRADPDADRETLKN
jgi:hypothetical protein